MEISDSQATRDEVAAQAGAIRQLMWARAICAGALTAADALDVLAAALLANVARDGRTMASEPGSAKVRRDAPDWAFRGGASKNRTCDLSIISAIVTFVEYGAHQDCCNPNGS